MNVSGVLAVVAVVAVLAALAWAAARRGRRRPVPSGPGPRRPAAKGGRRPAAREIWWAEVPFEDGPGAKDRPCLVLRVSGRTATVAKITSKHHTERPGVLALPPGTVGDTRGRTSWLETDELRDVPLRDFRRRVGPVDERTWARAAALIGS
ncbi:type II toxin-antitoxin system PemK/MazF family toxin [Kitasatospora sp. NBC_00315]|uniref:type II toxin-antitoxin system PemK/MazF family toxin n=1 Tax=Kitasatospora sp. NBC_00315 TaxID=2975963 RepID=UPI00324FD2F1